MRADLTSLPLLLFLLLPGLGGRRVGKDSQAYAIGVSEAL